MPEGSLLFAIGKEGPFFKIKGRADYLTAYQLKLVCNEFLHGKYEQLFIDLSECVVADSTFIGSLVQIHEKITEQMLHVKTPIILINPTNQIKEALEDLHVTDIFKIHQEQITPEIEYKEFPKEKLDKHSLKLALATTVLAAHEALLKKNPTLRERFAHLLNLLHNEIIRGTSR